jgi:hypothetical protein
LNPVKEISFKYCGNYVIYALREMWVDEIDLNLHAASIPFE